MLAAEYANSSVQITAVVVPVALYFLVLGLLNSRRHPQLLSGRLDFVLLIVALSPLVIVPCAGYLGWWIVPVAVAIVVAGAAASVLGSKEGTWVIYNTSPDQARSSISRALRQMNVDFDAKGGDFQAGPVRLEISGFAPLRNISIRMHGADRCFERAFARSLDRVLCTFDTQASPMAVSLLLVATAMLVAPMTLMAHRVPEIVRLLTDLLR